jgi:Phage XkdN-like tail assembly chaperone protein, TAC
MAQPSTTEAPSPDATQPSMTAPQEASDGRDVIDEVASQGVKGDANRAKDALEWFLTDEAEGETDIPTYTLELNVSTDPMREKIIQWVIRPIASTRIDELRRQHQAGGRSGRRRRGDEPQVDIARFNAALVYEATVSPDLRDVARRKQVASGGELVLHRFRHKPLLVDQIAGQVLQYSGADEDDLREAREVIAAKN